MKIEYSPDIHSILTEEEFFVLLMLYFYKRYNSPDRVRPLSFFP